MNLYPLIVNRDSSAILKVVAWQYTFLTRNIPAAVKK